MFYSGDVRADVHFLLNSLASDFNRFFFFPASVSTPVSDLHSSFVLAWDRLGDMMDYVARDSVDGMVRVDYGSCSDA